MLGYKKLLYSKLTENFQDGCDTIVAGCTTYGATPTSNSPTDIVNAIKKIYTDRYNAGKSSGDIYSFTSYQLTINSNSPIIILNNYKRVQFTNISALKNNWSSVSGLGHFNNGIIKNFSGTKLSFDSNMNILNSNLYPAIIYNNTNLGGSVTFTIYIK